ncbi:olfactory receptor 51E1-like [Discoglossus pictus]
MFALNTSSSSNADFNFILSELPGLGGSQFWFGFPLLLIYIVTMLGNSALLYVIRTEQSLHQPMYIFLFMLSVVDMLISTSVIPRMLGLFWFNAREIAFNSCLVQMFVIHFLTTMDSGTLMLMAVDRFIAICHPLRYTSILTNENIAKTTLVLAVRGLAGMMPLPILLSRLPFCRDNLLTHSYCLHQEAMKLACGDITVNIIFGLFVVISVMGLDSLFICLSYFLIVRTVAGLSEEASLKAMSTCTAHICAVLIYYIPLISASVVHRFGTNAVPNLAIVVGNMYLMVPPILNPFIYGIKTQQIRTRLSKLFSNKVKWKVTPVQS